MAKKTKKVDTFAQIRHQAYLAEKAAHQGPLRRAQTWDQDTKARRNKRACRGKVQWD